MVEGPGCTLNGEKVRARVKKGQKVLHIRGNESKSAAGFQSFVGCEFTGVHTLGKEMFMYFGVRALRLHFGMNGSMRINPVETKESKAKVPVLRVQLTTDAVSFYDTNVEIRLSEDCEQKVRAMEGLDICSPKFSFPRAVETVKRELPRMLCDVLLDQAVLPGVGNIIKNEALFDCGFSPAVKVSQLSHEQVQHLVKMTRDFTLLFYKCRKNGSALYKHYKVYKRPTCGHCGGTVTVCRMGDNARMTYYCQRCQTLDPSEVTLSKLPARNTLIGWANQGANREHVAKREEEEWPCHLCTLINPPSCKYCEACMSPKPEAPEEPTKPEWSPDLIRYPCNNFSRPLQETKMNRRTAFGTTTLVLTSIGTKPDTAASAVISRAPLSNGVSGTPPEHCKRKSPAVHAPPNKRMKTTSEGLSGGSGQPRATGSNEKPLPTIPLCTSHQRPCALRLVTKDGENKGRQFYTCSLPKDSQCKFFEWADMNFPMCHHAKRTLMKTVLKLGPNNGRNFYTCPVKMGKQCGFFQWAESGPGVSLLPGC